MTMSIEASPASAQPARTKDWISAIRATRDVTACDDADIRMFIRGALDEGKTGAGSDPAEIVERAYALVKAYRTTTQRGAPERDVGLRLGLPRNANDRRVIALEHYFFNRLWARRVASAADTNVPVVVDEEIYQVVTFGRFQFVLLGAAVLDRWSFNKKMGVARRGRWRARRACELIGASLTRESAHRPGYRFRLCT